MKKFLLPIAALAMIMLPAAANAAQCRDTASGKFAKCGAPGAVPASQYVAKGKSKTAAKSMATTMGTPTGTPTKPGFMAMMKSKAKPTPAPMGKPMMTTPMTAKPMMGKPMTAKAVRCKGMTGKFVKCGTPGAKPA